MRRTCVVALMVLAGCGGRSSGGGLVAASIAPARSETTSAVATSASPTTLELARRHAPQFRFNARLPGVASPANRHEDYFPQSVARFFDELASGRARIATAESGSGPGTNAVRASGRVSVEPTAIQGSPRRMSGDAPGQAPLYVHVYEDRTRRVRAADGSGEDLVFVEYWVFYPDDAAKVTVSVIGATLDVGGHRGDWEEVRLALAIVRGPGGAFLRSEVRRGFYSAHGNRVSLERAELGFVDERGQPDPRGDHPIVYVSVGKHAAYPEPGYWIDPLGLRPFVANDEFFLGNGYSWASWGSDLHDLEGPRTSEFAPPALATLVAPGFTLADWRDYKGRWGPDTSPAIPGAPPLKFGDSPTGPRAKGDYGSGDRGAARWADVKRTARDLHLGAVPAVLPTPVPDRLP